MGMSRCFDLGEGTLVRQRELTMSGDPWTGFAVNSAGTKWSKEIFVIIDMQLRWPNDSHEKEVLYTILSTTTGEEIEASEWDVRSLDEFIEYGTDLPTSSAS